ncbi:hypothetical protein BGZ63DRAFT_381709 [Mariannaea sp. PMI_226]|nr:hypothetical protein BGZ63DRAFT_381709 [Mariannaea sp. PMI_226]
MNTITQAFPPKPKFNDADVPDLSGRVCLVTGANTGVGKEVAQILYGKNAIVWVASRNEEKGRAAIVEIIKKHPLSKGTIKFLKLDLADLTTIPDSANKILAAETRLDLIFNNAGVMMPPQGSKTKQGYELQIGTNCVGPFLLTKLLTPRLISTAKLAPKDSVRVVWVSSSATDLLAPKGGIELDNLDYHQDRSTYSKYGTSKAGNYFHATEFAKKYRQDGILSIPLNPGNLRTELDRTAPWWLYLARVGTTYPPLYGAYTELFAAFSPEFTLDKSGTWVAPFGRFLPVRDDVFKGSLSEAEGGTGMAEKFWTWSEEQVKPYL